MEDSMDMDMSPLRPQNYLFGCQLKADKDYYFKVSLGAGAKDELHIVEAEAMNYEGSPIKVTLAALKMSVQPMKKIKFAADIEEDDDDDSDEHNDDDFDHDHEETEEKAPVKKQSIPDTLAENTQKSNQNGRTQNYQYKDQKFCTTF